MSDTLITDAAARFDRSQVLSTTAPARYIVDADTARQIENMCAELAAVLGEPLVTNEWLDRRRAVLDKWQAMKENAK